MANLDTIPVELRIQILFKVDTLAALKAAVMSFQGLHDIKESHGNYWRVILRTFTHGAPRKLWKSEFQYIFSKCINIA
ncbi:hypothetical protein TWF569_007494 [Orbilia oligospora]|uniref:Uncharacterized protein n=1 Tax=Orbilia oligospora TaxID=2813651 RepID=A0A7C8NWE7_ORBOL|nr:hypothetical protein TWF103_005790 [Orbilia oligospora]KAF3111243.1 hypothetical protein TWF102_006918 [Orbilia oligospora]KAF3114232.1 hypothetical protein TWF706_008171 [Orbilia oligospora]KAF3137161.1 hypothetical protein TWF594_007673 [Orbilia oligospora]KAF3137214.1 hypothetical protein TWF703_005136 [Orbilia oligospora]